MKKTIINTVPSPQDDKLHLIVNGPLCGMEAMKMKNMIIRSMDTPVTSLIIDLRNTDDIDLTGINMLAMVYKYLKDKHTDYSIIVNSSNSWISKVKETKLHRFLPFNYQAQ